ncbi:hypothetical protein BS50DRAFT_578508 [Corynespora cassiicola Philippines]|uniref:VOC domain-containing protein n=1 Tax=Corynespora cassiicola Philippines TaxID=1448308 RepID=A0A2T2N7Y8_CORCC|nr:hypothetical protein BS50DRAFT_578508 [Corynespora cassiicola Philippines]
MTINHIFVYVNARRMSTMLSFYKKALEPLGYTEMINAFEGNTVGLGSDYPYLWLQSVPDDHKPYPLHIAIDAPNNEAVEEFYKIGLDNDAKDNGKPGIRETMSRQPYYAAYLIDSQGNNLEAVCVDKDGVRGR